MFDYREPASLRLEEEERQLVLMALAELSVRCPGFDDAINRIAVRIDNAKDGRAVMYDSFREFRRTFAEDA
jgi:hypothetical protein